MKPLTEIKKMLEEISPWPWSYIDWPAKIPDAKSFNILNEYGHGILNITDYVDSLASAENNASFIANSPEIISQLVSEVERLEKENSQLKLDLLTAQAQADGEYDESLKKEELALALKDNACISAIAQVGGDPAIVGEMLELIKEMYKYMKEIREIENYPKESLLERHLRRLIAKAERKV